LNAAILLVGANILLFKPGTLPAAPLDHYPEPLGFKPIALHYFHGGLRVEGQLNGRPLSAIVDCGANFSEFDLDYVQKVAEARVHDLNLVGRGIVGRNLKISGFTPNELDLGSLNIAPIEIGASSTPYFAKTGANALLGYDLLGVHKAIVDLGHDILWLK
jgi:hypothetical protein